MVSLRVLWFLMLLMPAIALAEQASVRLSTENAQIFVGDAIIIDIESVGLLEPLDVGPLKKIAVFDRETIGTRIAVVEGKVVEIKIRRMEFTATDAGTVIFGPLTGVASNGDVTSNAISINIAQANVQQWAPTEQDISFEFTLNNNSPYIHQQIVANLVLRHRYPVADESIVLPDFDQFDVVPLFERRRTLDATDDGWRLISWQWLLHPKVSGKLTFNGPGWSGLMVKSRTQRGTFALPSKPTSLSVQPAINSDWWLPAASVVLADSWSSPVIEISAGDEIIRTVSVTATGVLSQQIPDIVPLASRAISSVLISSQREQTTVNNTITSKAEFKFRMTAQSPIPVFLDTIRVPWWNTVENKMSEAIIPARRINVGLPERADVLANLALKRTPWERLKLFVKTTGVSWQLPAVLFATLVAFYLWLSKSLHAQQLFKRISQAKHIRRINRAVKNQQWPQLWTLLESAPSTIRGSKEFHMIHTHCKHKLFAQDQSNQNTSLPRLRRTRQTKGNTGEVEEYLPPLSI